MLKDGAYRVAAKEVLHDPGVLEIDPHAKVSRGNGQGAYVQAWVWISDDVAKDYEGEES